MLEGIALEVSGGMVMRHLLKLTKGRMLRTIKSRLLIEVPVEGHFIRQADKESNVSFEVKLTSPASAPLRVSKVDYEVLYRDAVVQDRRSITPNTELRGIMDFSLVHLIYLPLTSSLGLPLEEGGWGVRGVVTIECFYGDFVKEFTSQHKLVVGCGKGESWQQARERFLRLRASIEGEGKGNEPQ